LRANRYASPLDWDTLASMSARAILGIACATLLVATSSAAQTNDPAAAAIGRGVAFLRVEVPKWRKDHPCYSCHNNGDATRALLVAGARGHDIGDSLDDTITFLKDPSKWDQNKAPGGLDDKTLARIQFASALAVAERHGRAASTDLQAAAKAAGCRTRNFPVEGRDHVEGEVTYRTNPPTSGNHNINPAPDGVYEPGNTPAKENYVHTLEHGRVLFQYAPGLPARRVSQLETLFNERDGYHVAVFENNTKMPVEFAATAWLQQLTCPKFNDRVFDAARAFRARYTDKAPEFIP